MRSRSASKHGSSQHNLGIDSPFGQVRETLATLVGMEGVSQTAVFAAQVRAAHGVLDRNPIFEDPFAMVLADASEQEIQELFALIPAACARVARVLPNQRARFVEEEVERAIRNGIRQYVFLGAGLDSFAWRRPDLMADIELYEVDHPSTQEWKRLRMGRAGLVHPANLHFVGMNFEIDELRPRCLGSDSTQGFHQSGHGWESLCISKSPPSKRHSERPLT